MNNFALVLLTSTRQHFGAVNIDKYTVNDILSKSSIVKNCYKLVHIKTLLKDREIAEEKKKWFKDKGFEVLETIGEWSNDNESHGRGLINDMAKVYNYSNLLSMAEYVMNLENDWKYNVEDMNEYLYKSMWYLNNNQSLIYHRYSRIDQSDLPNRINASLINEKEKFFATDNEFSFNPFISRTRDMKYISAFVAKNNIHAHCEKAYELAAKYLLNNDNIFSFTHNQIVEHIGCPESIKKYNIQ